MVFLGVQPEELCEKSLASKALAIGGAITPLIVSPDEYGGLGLMNPSIIHYKDKYLINVRNVSYTLHHCDGPNTEEGIFQTPWGPLNYVRPDGDPYLRTTNFIGELTNKVESGTLPDGKQKIKIHMTNNFELVKPHKINTDKFPKLPEWDFVGHEDGRLIDWEGKLWISGVRRLAPDGRGRMQLSEIKRSMNTTREVSRNLIEPPVYTFCEKNWMPILDMPFHYVKWLDPLEIVEVDRSKEPWTSKIVHTGKSLPVKDNSVDLRGGSQVILFNDYRICLVHDTDYWQNEKGDRDSHYNHRMVCWDKDWNLNFVTKPFKFMGGRIEFCCGMAKEGDNLLITFGWTDNSAYLLRIPFDYFLNSLDKEKLL